MGTTITIASFLPHANLAMNGPLFVQSPPDTPAAAVAQHAISEFLLRFTEEEAEVRKKRSLIAEFEPKTQ